jgi:O-antigen/teichoic acid export membrane protein
MNNRGLFFGTLTIGGANAIKFGLQLIFLPVMARLLGPRDFGLFGLAMPTVTFMLLLTDGGLGISLAREPESNTDVWSAAFWLLLGTGVVLGAVVIVWAHVLAGLVDESRLTAIMTTLAVCPTLLALSVHACARLNRQGRLAIGSLGDLLGTMLGMASAIILALLGAGAWSLVAQTVLLWACRALVTNMASPFAPDWRFSRRDLHSHLKVGGWIVSGRLIDAGGRTIEVSLLARTLGIDFVGAYGLANQISRYVSDTMITAVWSMLYVYGIRTESQSTAARVYYSAIRVVALVMFPTVVMVSTQAKPLVDTLLGTRWDSAILMLQILLVSTVVGSVGNLGGALLCANGVAQVPARIGMEANALRIVAVAAQPWIGVIGMTVGLGLVGMYVFVRGIRATSRFLRKHLLLSFGAQPSRARLPGQFVGNSAGT